MILDGRARRRSLRQIAMPPTLNTHSDPQCFVTYGKNIYHCCIFYAMERGITSIAMKFGGRDPSKFCIHVRYLMTKHSKQ